MAEILKLEIVKVNTIKGGVEAFVRAWKNGEQIGFGHDGTVDVERFRIFNPPSLVPDKNGEVLRVRKADPEAGIEYKESRFRNDPESALEIVLRSLVEQVGKDGTNIIKGKFGNTVTTLYPSAGANSPVDGRLYKDGSSWSDGRDATTADLSLTDETDTQIARSDGSNFRFVRGVFCFDTSVIGSDTISSATLSIFGTGTAKADADSTTVDVVSVTLASFADLADGDYDGFGTTSYASKDITAYTDTDGAENTWALDATGRAYIDPDGITALGMRTGADISDSPTSGSNNIYGYYADEVGTTYDPKLVIEHTTSGSPSSSPSPSPSSSVSLSPSSSVSSSVSASPSPSPSASESASVSSSPSPSESASVSSSPSPSESSSPSAGTSESSSPSPSVSSSPSPPSSSVSSSASSSPSSSTSPSSSVSSSPSPSESASPSASVSASPSPQIWTPLPRMSY